MWFTRDGHARVKFLMEVIVKLAKNWLITIFITSGLVFVGYYMLQQKFQMAVIVTPESESDPEWPAKEKWFDASEWLKSSQYLKIDDFYILNVKYVPVENLNNFQITMAIQEAIKKSLNLEPGLLALDKMDDQDFFQWSKDKLTYEYLRTDFDSSTLTPINDYFLFFFTYKGVDYEVEVLRIPYRDDFAFPYAGYVHNVGYWHSVSPAEYSYRDYHEGKPLTK